MTAPLRWGEARHLEPGAARSRRGWLPPGLVVRRLGRDRALGVAVGLVLAVLAVAAGLLPGQVAATLDADLRQAVTAAPGPARRLDAVRPGTIAAGGDEDPLSGVTATGAEIRADFEPAVQAVLGPAEAVVRTVNLESVERLPGRVRFLTLRVHPEAEEHLRIVEGAAPGVATEPGVVEVALSARAAEELLLGIGDELPLTTDPADPYVRVFGTLPPPPGVEAPPLVTLRVTGLLDGDEDDPFLVDERNLIEPNVVVSPSGSTRTVRASALMAAEAYGDLIVETAPNPLLAEWRFPVDPERLDAGAIAGLRAALSAQAQRFADTPFVPLGQTRLTGGLDNLLAEASARRAAAAGLATSALTAVVGVALTVLLAVGLVRAESRRTEARLLQGRGAAGRALLLADALEVLLLALPAGVLGVAAALLTGSGVHGVLGAVATALVAGLVLLVAARPGPARPHRRAAARRTVAQVAVALLAAGAAGALLRTPVEDAAPDPLAAAAPVLLAIAAGLVLARAVTPAMRLVSPLAGRTRGLVAGVTLRAIARRPGVGLGVVAVLVATASATQLAAVSVSGEAARTARAWEQVGADVLVEDPAAGELADRLPGVTTAARAALIPGATVGVAALGIDTGESAVLALETRSYAAVVAGTPSDGAIPADLLVAADDRVPALASVAAVGRRQLVVGDELEAAGVPLRIVATARQFPSLPPDTPFLVVPLQAWADAGGEAAVTRAYLRSEDPGSTARAASNERPAARVATIAAARDALTGTPLARGTGAAVRLASVLSAVFAALAVAVTAARAVRGRRGEVAPLLAVGAAPSEVVAILAAELVAGVAIGAGAGLLVGVGTTRLLAGGIDLAVLSGTGTAALQSQPLVGLAVGGFLAALAGVAAATVGRRQRRDLAAALRTEGH